MNKHSRVVIEFFYDESSDLTKPTKAIILTAIQKIEENGKEVEFIDMKTDNEIVIKKLMDFYRKLINKDIEEENFSGFVVPLTVINGKKAFLGYNDNLGEKIIESTY